MANIKSQKKRALTNIKRNLQNTAARSRLKTAIKTVKKAVDADNKAAAVTALNRCNALLDGALAKHLKHQNYVAREKSRLQVLVNKMQ